MKYPTSETMAANRQVRYWQHVEGAGIHRVIEMTTISPAAVQFLGNDALRSALDSQQLNAKHDEIPLVLVDGSVNSSYLTPSRSLADIAKDATS